MLKPLVVAFGVALFASSAASAAEQRYQGTFFVTEVNAACRAGDSSIDVGTNYVFAFRTGNGEAFALFGSRSAYQIEPNGSDAFKASGPYAGTKIGAGGSASELAGQYSKLTINPDAPSDANQQILVKGGLTNFDHGGCTVKFVASGARRPDF